MMFVNTKTQRGYTAVEALFYIVILLIVSVVSVHIFISLGGVIARNKVDRILTENATVALERILYEIRSAESIDTGLSTFTTSPGRLALDNGTTSVAFMLSGGVIQITSNGVSRGSITSTGITIQNLTFWRYEGVSTDLVRVALTAQSAGYNATSTRTYYGSAVLRESYE